MACQHMPWSHSWDGKRYVYTSCRACLNCSRKDCSWPGHKRCPCVVYDNCGDTVG